LEEIFNPIITKIYQEQGGVPGGMPGGMPGAGGFPGGANFSGTSGGAGPKVDEVD